MVARRQADSHHAVEREVEEGEVHEEEVPEEFGNCPFEPNHRVHYDPVYGGLSQSVWEFNGNLYIYNGSFSDVVSDLSSIEGTIYISSLYESRSHLSKCIWQSRVHAGSSFTVKHGPLHRDYWLDRCSIQDADEHHCSIHGPHGIEQICG